MVKHLTYIITASFLAGVIFMWWNSAPKPKRVIECGGGFAIAMVCTKPVRAGQRISEFNAQENGFAAASVPRGTLSKMIDVEGATAVRDLKKGDFINFRDIDPSTQRGILSAYRTKMAVEEGECLSFQNVDIVKVRANALPRTFLSPSFVGLQKIRSRRNLPSNTYVRSDDVDLVIIISSLRTP